MTAFILTIFKTAGVILLAALCLILAGLLLILLVPVRFRLSAVFPETAGSASACGKEEDQKEKTCAEGFLRVTWLARLICFQARFQAGGGSKNDQACLKARLTVLGISIWPRRKRKADEESTVETDKTGGAQTQGKAAGPSPAIRQARTENFSEPHEPELQVPKPPPLWDAADGRREATGAPDERRETQSFFERIAAAARFLCERLKSLFTNSAHAAAVLGERAERLGQAWDYYQELFHSDDTGKVLNKLMRHVKKLFRHILPQKFSASLTLGTGDPASTANLLALHGMFYPLVGETVHITPDFDRACLAGELSVRGRVRLCVPIYHLLAVILDKRTWRLIRQLKKEEVANGR